MTFSIILMWIREAAGWLLILAGLFLFFLCVFSFLPEGKIIESGPLTLIGIIVFRGGIHLLKVAVAARVCLQAQESATGAHAPAPPAQRRRPSVATWTPQRAS